MADETAGPERDRPPVGSVGSVAEETARLLDALLAGTSGAGRGERARIRELGAAGR